jgi:cysteinyl-tRNA synthetase
MKLYNTLTRKLDELVPINQDKVSIYSCGPTVYDHAHIGNLSSYIFADTLRRVIALKHPVLQAMNYTDVDDKTIRRSREQYPDMDAKEALKKLTEHYIGLFLQDLKRIGNDVDAITFLKATDSIDGMKQLITELHDKGFAYIADDGVYFSIEAYKKSGKKYGQLLEITAGNTSEARIQNDEYDKESVHDFALWKSQKPGEPAWDFILDGHDLTGRPGWHVECSVMSRQALGQPFDIHTGGVDLIFPHHENEIAQSTANETDPVMAQIFAHNEHILVDGKKMAKSAQNFYTLEDIIKKGYDPLAFRLLVLQAHYRNQVNFTFESLNGAAQRLLRYRNFAALRFQGNNDHNDNNDGSSTAGAADISGIVQALEEDLDTPRALVALEAVIDSFESAEAISYDDLTQVLTQLDAVFGLSLLGISDITDEQKKLIYERQAARDNKDWAKSDELRDTLLEQGIGVRDNASGPIWYHI